MQPLWYVDNPEVLGRDHEETVLCREGQAQRAQYAAVATSSKALEGQFTVNGEELKRIEVFKYLGWFMAYDNNDVRAVKSNLRKV